MQTNTSQPTTQKPPRERKPYDAPRVVHVAELETRAGTPIGGSGGNSFDPITEQMRNPWDPDYTEGP